MKRLNLIILLIAGLILTACASKQNLSTEQVDARYPLLKALQADIAMAEKNQVDILSSQLFQTAQTEAAAAQKYATHGNEKTDMQIDRARISLKRAIENAEIAREELSIVLEARERAIKASADSIFSVSFETNEKELKEFGDLIAKGKLADVREDRQALTQKYINLEVESLKRNTAKTAQEFIDKASATGADDHAPELLRKAKEELNLAKKVLETNRDASDKAAFHADLAHSYAARAIQVTEIIKEFKQSDMSDEQRVLWYQNQLTSAVAPVFSELDFGIPNKSLIASIASTLDSLVQEKALLVKTHKKEIALLEQKLADKELLYQESLTATEMSLSALQSQTAADRQREKMIKEKFSRVQAMFDESEAEVFRQGNNLLIRAYGFTFASGKSEIQSVNFPLMNKIIESVRLFPAGKVQVSGHTDNRGADDLNMSLSEDRAKKVSAFLTDVGQVSAAKVSSKGYGKTRPLASNESAEGRAANRRVEILIVNE